MALSKLMTGVVLAFMPASVTLAAEHCPTNGPASVEELASNWILVGWEKKPGDGPLDFRRQFDRYYDWSGTPGQIFYDDFDPKRRVVRTPDAYGAIWEPAFTALRSARHALSIAPSALYGGGLAVSTLEFVALLEDAKGKVTAIRTLSTLTWRCSGDRWRIAREHNSSTVVPRASISSYFEQPGRR